jgi:glycosyltransferase involved in cell wall biosynthesis
MNATVLLFFPSAPIEIDAVSAQPTWVSAPTAQVFRVLLKALTEEVLHGSVILGAETHPMCDALSGLTGLPVQYYPHPVSPFGSAGRNDCVRSSDELVIGSYGGAREEKGERSLIAAVDLFTRRYASSRSQFVLQCVGGNPAEWKRLVGRRNVQLISSYFDGQYANQVTATHLLLLPYLRSSYGLRVSRVAIEAMVNGIPIVATRGTTLASQAEKFGSAVLCNENDPESLAEAIRDCELRYDELRRAARMRMTAAREHFSVLGFRQRLCLRPAASSSKSCQTANERSLC